VDVISRAARPFGRDLLLLAKLAPSGGYDQTWNSQYSCAYERDGGQSGYGVGKSTLWLLCGRQDVIEKGPKYQAGLVQKVD
jgi:hypothetical protein